MYLEYLFTDWEVKAEADFKRREKKRKEKSKNSPDPHLPSSTHAGLLIHISLSSERLAAPS